MQPRKPLSNKRPAPPSSSANNFEPNCPFPPRQADPAPESRSPSSLPRPAPSSSPLSSAPSEDVLSAISRWLEAKEEDGLEAEEGGKDSEDGDADDESMGEDEDDGEYEPGQSDAKRSRETTHAAQPSQRLKERGLKKEQAMVEMKSPKTRHKPNPYPPSSATPPTPESNVPDEPPRPEIVSGSSILTRNLQVLGVNVGQGGIRNVCETAFEKGRDLLIDYPLSYNETVTVCFLLCLNLMDKLKRQRRIPEEIDEQGEDPRTEGINYSKGTEDPLADSLERLSAQGPVGAQSASTAAASSAGIASSLPEQLAKKSVGDRSSLEADGTMPPTIKEDKGGGVPGEQDPPISISEDSNSLDASRRYDTSLSMDLSPSQRTTENEAPSTTDRPSLVVRLKFRQDHPLFVQPSQRTTENETPSTTDRPSLIDRLKFRQDIPLFVQPKGTQPIIESNSVSFDVVILCSSPDLAICYYDIFRMLMRGIGLAVSLVIETDKHEAQEQEISRGCNILISDFKSLIKLIQVFETKISVLFIEDASGVLQHSHEQELEELNNVLTEETRFILASPWWSFEAQYLVPDLLIRTKKRRNKMIRHVGTKHYGLANCELPNENPLYARHEVRFRKPENMESLYQRLVPLERSGEAKVLILCREVKAVNELWPLVKKWGFVTRTHLTDRLERDKILDRWNTGEIRAVLTTEDLADGMAMEGITDLVTWQLPMNKNVRISEWKYWRRLERDHMKAPQTLVFFTGEDEAMFWSVATMAVLGEPAASEQSKKLKRKAIVEVMMQQCLARKKK